MMTQKASTPTHTDREPPILPFRYFHLMDGWVGEWVHGRSAEGTKDEVRTLQADICHKVDIVQKYAVH